MISAKESKIILDMYDQFKEIQSYGKKLESLYFAKGENYLITKVPNLISLANKLILKIDSFKNNEFDSKFIDAMNEMKEITVTFVNRLTIFYETHISYTGEIIA